MSNALASARRRRAGPETVAPAPGTRQTIPQPSFPGQQAQSNMKTGLTLPQVIAVVDKRLIDLETFVNEQKETAANTTFSANQEAPQSGATDFAALIEEYNARFDIIADEIANMKDLIMKLQSYTMEVNKSLMEDRIRILSDTNITFSGQHETITPLEQALNAVELQQRRDESL
jgi:hypothetical protein